MQKKYDTDIVVDGNTYKNINDVCDHYKIKKAHLIRRLQKGASLEDAIKACKNKGIVVEGVYYESLKAAVSHYGLNYATVSNRLQSPYWTIDEAFELVEHNPVVAHTGSSKEIVVENKTYPSIDAACKEYGVPRALAYTRRKRGWSMDEVFGIKKRDTSKYGYSHCGRKNAKAVTIDGVSFDSIKQAAEHYGIKNQTLYWRLKNGASIEDALTTKPKRTKE